MTEDPAVYGLPSRTEEAKAQLARVLEVAGCRTQAELAEVLDIRQSSIAEAKRRGSIPSDWLLKLLRLRGVNPDWILLGSGPKFLTPIDDSSAANYAYEAFPPVRAIDAQIVKKVLRCFPVRDLEGELLRRKRRLPDGDP